LLQFSSRQYRCISSNDVFTTEDSFVKVPDHFVT